MKRSIKLNDVFDILRQCPVVDLESRLLETQLYDLTGDPSNEFLSLFWTDEDDEGSELHVMITFTEGDNKTCILDGNVLTLKSSENKEIKFLNL